MAFTHTHTHRERWPRMVKTEEHGGRARRERQKQYLLIVKHVAELKYNTRRHDLSEAHIQAAIFVGEGGAGNGIILYILFHICFFRLSCMS